MKPGNLLMVRHLKSAAGVVAGATQPVRGGHAIVSTPPACIRRPPPLETGSARHAAVMRRPPFLRRSARV